MTKSLLFLILFLSINCSQKWLPEVNGYSDYAGIMGKPVTSLRVSGGKQYRVHTLNGKWLPAVTGNDPNDPSNGYAGNDGVAIDAIAVQGATYKVHILGGSWLPEVSKYDINDEVNGMAGDYGKQIDAVMIKDRVYATAYAVQQGGYSRSGAVDYARKYAFHINHQCGSHDSCTPCSYWGWEHCNYGGDGDCANFVSQCLVLGGGHPKLKGSDNCRGYPCGFEEVGAKRLGDCLKEKGWTRTCGYLQAPPSNIKAGDALIYHKDNCNSYSAHAVFVTQGGSNALIACHSNEQLDVSYTYMGTSMPYYEWLHYND